MALPEAQLDDGSLKLEQVEAVGLGALHGFLIQRLSLGLVRRRKLRTDRSALFGRGRGLSPHLCRRVEEDEEETKGSCVMIN